MKAPVSVKIVPVKITVNGEQFEGSINPRVHLADFLRETLHCTGTHIGCEHGVCGACTVWVDGAPVRSCIAFTPSLEGAEITTIEGFDNDPLMGELRQAFSACHALQCGYCTPGMLITAYDIVRRIPEADEARIREELAGNLCRCTGYLGIVEAIESVVAGRAGKQTSGELEVSQAQARLPPAAANLVYPRIASEPAAGQRGSSAPESAEMPAAPAALVGNGGDTSSAAPSLPVPSLNDNRLRRQIQLDMAASEVWAVIRDPARCIPCLPGAAVVSTSTAGAEPSEAGGLAHETNLELSMAVGIGPMRTQFRGPARFQLDDKARVGKVLGEAEDRLSRTRGSGEVGFAVHQIGPAETRLEISLSYALVGPLAQFGRAAVVEAVVDRLLTRFAANLETLVTGREDRGPSGQDGPPSLGVWKRILKWWAGESS